MINKFGNGKAVRLSDRKVLWELNVDPKNRGEEPLDVTAPTYYKGKVFGAFKDGHLAAGDAKTGKKVWVEAAHRTRIVAAGVDGPLYIGTNAHELLALDPDGKTVWKFNAPGEDQSEPELSRREGLLRRLLERMFALDAEERQEDLEHRHQPGAPWPAAASSPPPRSPSATSTPPATTAPSTPST